MPATSSCGRLILGQRSNDAGLIWRHRYSPPSGISAARRVPWLGSVKHFECPAQALDPIAQTSKPGPRGWIRSSYAVVLDGDS